MLASSLAGITCLAVMCAPRGDTYTEAMASRIDQIIAVDGLTVTMEAMLNHPVLKKDELSSPRSYEPDDLIQVGLNLLNTMTDEAAPGHEERRGTLRKAGVLQVLVPVVAAFAKAEIEAGMKPDVRLFGNKVKASCHVVHALIFTDRRGARIKGGDPLRNVLTEEDKAVLVGTKEKPGFLFKACSAVRREA